MVGVNKRHGHGRVTAAGTLAFCIAALGTGACGTASSEPTERPTEGHAELARANTREMPPASSMLDRHVPGLRRASAEEVSAHFDRMKLARERTRSLAEQPPDPGELLAKMKSVSNRRQRLALADHYLETVNQLSGGDRETALARLREALNEQAP